MWSFKRFEGVARTNKEKSFLVKSDQNLLKNCLHLINFNKNIENYPYL